VFEVEVKSRNKWLRYLELLGLCYAWACVTFMCFVFFDIVVTGDPWILTEPNKLLAVLELIGGIISFFVMVKKLLEWR